MSSIPGSPGGDTRVLVSANATSTIRNPGYPGYQDNMDVGWVLESPPNTRIKIRIS